MEIDHPSALQDELMNEKKRPEMLKVICILSFVACGLLILTYGFGTMLLSLDPNDISAQWEKATEQNPQLADIDPAVFMHEAGLYCLYSLIATIFSLIGVIMMWRLEKIGFFLYVLAELSTNFFTVKLNTEQEPSYAGTIFSVLIDIVFIVLYAVNLKYMNKKNNNTFVQSGS